MPALEKVRCPVLAVFGQRDTYLPVDKSVAVWRASLARAGNSAVTIRVFPRGDHSLLEVTTGGLKETGRLSRFVPGCYDVQRDWLLKRVTIAR